MHFRWLSVLKLYSRNCDIRSVLEPEKDSLEINVLGSVKEVGLLDKRYDVKTQLAALLFRRNWPFLAYDRSYRFGEALEDPLVSQYFKRKNYQEYGEYRKFLNKLTQKARRRALRLKNKSQSIRRAEVAARWPLDKSDTYTTVFEATNIPDASLKSTRKAYFNRFAKLYFSRAEKRF